MAGHFYARTVQEILDATDWSQFEIIHWWFPGHPLCEEYATGDAVIDHDKTLVNCQECLEMMHS